MRLNLLHKVFCREGVVGLKKSFVNKIKFSKNDFDHVDFAVPARIKNLTYWTTASDVCWSVRLRTFTTAVTRVLAEFFSFFDVLQYFSFLLRT